MLGTEFTRTLRAAQAGDEAAFERLFRDANPAMVRYLRVAGVDDPYDAACEGWITVLRGLPGFCGDEVAWRVWLLACTRLRAEEGTLRQGWSAVTVLPGAELAPGGESLEVDELIASEDEMLQNRGVNETIAAIRDLPVGQGEILMLRLAGGLPVTAVADVVGTDALSVRRSETRALERLGADRELVAWSLDAPAMPAELADERVALGAFRSLPESKATASTTRVIAIGPAATLRATRVVGRSRTALLGLAAASVSVMSLGGLSAAAYVGALPQGVQQVMHDVIGAPAPSASGDAGRSGPSPARTRLGGAAVGPEAGGSAALGMCRAWAVEQAQGAARDRSVAFRNLATAAGGADKVEGYCAAALAAHRGSSGATGTAVPKGKPTATRPAPTRSPHTKPAPANTKTADAAPTTSTSDAGATTPDTTTPDTTAPETTTSPTSPQPGSSRSIGKASGRAAGAAGDSQTQVEPSSDATVGTSPRVGSGQSTAQGSPIR